MLDITLVLTNIEKIFKKKKEIFYSKKVIVVAIPHPIIANPPASLTHLFHLFLRARVSNNKLNAVRHANNIGIE